MKISYGITVHNEADELNRLLEILIHQTESEDEIVICDDYSNQETQDVITSWNQQYGDLKVIKYYKRKFENDFAAQKNSVIKASEGDYIFHLDADEYPHDTLLSQIRQVLEMNEVDLIWVPRVNTVEGLTDEHCVKWGWRVTDKGWINYPDYQARIFRNSPEIRWVRPVHESIEGAKKYSHLPPVEELGLYHPKTIEKQEKQNALYTTISNQ